MEDEVMVNFAVYLKVVDFAVRFVVAAVIRTKKKLAKLVWARC